MLRPMPIGPIPPETARVARTAFPEGPRYLRLADELDTLFTDEAFLALFPTRGPPAWPPWRLALVTVLACRGSSPRPRSGQSRLARHAGRHRHHQGPAVQAG
jgi:transposase